MEFHFHTKILLSNPEGKILVQKRTDTGKWDLIGGKTEIPERIEDAIIREIEEETGIVDVEDLRTLYLESNFSEERNRYFVLILFTGKTKILSPKISDEHNEYRWIEKEELFSIGMSDYLEKALKKIKGML